MIRQVVPRVCRHVKNNHLGPIARNYRRELPIRWIRSTSPWDGMFPNMRPFFRSNFDDHFRDMTRAMDEMMSRLTPYSRYPARTGPVTRTESAEVTYDTSSFKVKVDVQQYDADHLKVSLVDSRLVISGKHETKADQHGFVSREFSREFLLPEDVDRESLSSRLSEDGYLLIKADVKGAKPPEEKVIEIKMEAEKKEEKDK